MMRIFLLIWATLMLSGCFWESNPPDLNTKDHPKKLAVIWDQKISKDAIERSSWVTNDKARLEKLMSDLDTQSWKSASVLPTCHSTRIILEMKSGKIWEICRSSGQPMIFRMFDRNNRGWSGQIDRSDAFLDDLAQMIESETGLSVDLSAEYRRAISKGTLHKIIPNSTQQILDKYPGYPESIWNADLRKFEYSPE